MHVCPKCGAPEGSKKFIGPFCADCYYFKIEMPDRLEVARCKRCGRVKLHGKWVPYSEKKIKEFVVGKFIGKFGKAEFDLERGVAKFYLKKDGKDGATNELEKRVNFGFVNDICPECNRRAGGYYEAIVQLRGNPTRVEKYLKILDSRIAHETFISKVVELKEGLDIYVGSTKAVLAIMKQLGLKHKTSFTLAGLRQGKRIYRTTFAIRL